MFDGEITVHIDFTEKEQYEIQAAHWSNKQIIVVTGVVWFLKDGTVERRSFALVTDYLGNVKYAVCWSCFLEYHTGNIGVETSFHKVHFFSDGAARQLRVAYNNAYRRVLGYAISDSASNMFVNNRVENYDAHNRHLIYSLRSRLLDSDNQIVACLNECFYIRGRYMCTSWRESLYM